MSRNDRSVFRAADGYRFFDVLGTPIPSSSLTVHRCIKAECGEPRQSYCVDLAGRPALMKVRQMLDLRGRVRATLGHPYLRREQQFIQAAIGCQLPVVGCLGHGWKREYGLITEQILLLEWLEDHCMLRDAVSDSHRGGDRDAVRCELLPIMTDLFLAVRLSGIADKDFGAHNILLRSMKNRTQLYRWVDLERCVFASADDPRALAEMTGSALASWWVGTAGSIEETRFAWDRLRQRAFERVHGDVIAMIDREMRDKLAKLVARRWVDQVPPADLLFRRAA